MKEGRVGEGGRGKGERKEGGKEGERGRKKRNFTPPSMKTQGLSLPVAGPMDHP